MKKLKKYLLIFVTKTKQFFDQLLPKKKARVITNKLSPM